MGEDQYLEKMDLGEVGLLDNNDDRELKLEDSESLSHSETDWSEADMTIVGRVSSDDKEESRLLLRGLNVVDVL